SADFSSPAALLVRAGPLLPRSEGIEYRQGGGHPPGASLGSRRGGTRGVVLPRRSRAAVSRGRWRAVPRSGRPLVYGLHRIEVPGATARPHALGIHRRGGVRIVHRWRLGPWPVDRTDGGGRAVPDGALRAGGPRCPPPGDGLSAVRAGPAPRANTARGRAVVGSVVRQGIVSRS